MTRAPPEPHPVRGTTTGPQADHALVGHPGDRARTAHLLSLHALHAPPQTARRRGPAPRPTKGRPPVGSSERPVAARGATWPSTRRHRRARDTPRARGLLDSSAPMNRTHPIEAQDRASRDGSTLRPDTERSTERRIPVSVVAGDAALALRVVVGQRVALHRLPSAGVLVLGRSARCDVVIPDESVSRRHARIVVGPRVAIEDLGSANGTRVGDTRIAVNEPVPIAPGEVVRVGGALLFLELAAARATTRRGRPRPSTPRARRARSPRSGPSWSASQRGPSPSS
jgi:hypothetical protein